MFKKIITLILTLCLCFTVLCACQDEKKEEEQTTPPPAGEEVKPYEYKGTNPAVQINLTDGRFIRVELYPELAPLTVANFLGLVEEKFYDNVVFHRIIDGFMVQAGLYKYSGENSYTKTPERATITGEFNANSNTVNTLLHTAGVISMARTSSDMNSASTQFFIVSETSKNNSSSLDGNYAAFGKTLDDESLATVVEISRVQTSTLKISASYVHEDFPVEPVVIASVVRLDKASE